MKKLHLGRAKKTLCGRILCRLIGDEKGAVAMEYIVIALLVAAAVVGLVMVFSGNLRNMFAKTNDTLAATTVTEVNAAGKDLRDEKADLKTQNANAVMAGDKLGGDFTDYHKGSGSGGNGSGGNGSGN